jgi:drug/metabolite transporter (DMT)-like permease
MLIRKKSITFTPLKRRAMLTYIPEHLCLSERGTMYINQSMKSKSSAVVYACIAVLSWSTVATAFKIALTHLTTFEMLLVASSTALVIFAGVLTFQRKWRQLRHFTPKQWSRFALLGLLNPTIYYLVLFKAYDLLPAQVAQPINYAWPILLLVLLALFAHQPIPGRKYIGMFISLGGVALISIGTGRLGGTPVSLYGLLLATLSALLWAVYWMINKRFAEQIDSNVVLFMSFLFGTLYLWANAAIGGAELHTLPGVLSGIYVGAFEMGIPFIFFGLAMQKTSNLALVNQLCYLSPFLSLFFISVVLGEHIVLTTYLGLSLIVAGIMFNQYLVKQ